MHTSTRMLVCDWGRAVPQRSLPPCGGGTGRGVQHALPLFCISVAQQMQASCRSRVLLCGTNFALFALGALSPPLSLSLPRKGGGNRVACTFVTHATRLRHESEMCACLSACAGTNGECCSARIPIFKQPSDTFEREKKK